MEAAAQAALGRPVEEIRAEFPLLALREDGGRLAYLDSGATAQKPLAVIQALDRFWREQNSNVHRGVYSLAERADKLYEDARATVASHLGGRPREIVFAKNATEAINLVAHAWGRASGASGKPNVGEGDRILLTELRASLEHRPWYLLAQERGAQLDWVAIDGDGRLDMDSLRSGLERGPKLVSFAHVSNVLGTVTPVAEIAALAHEAGALVLVDGAQAAPKMEIDAPGLGADFYAMTGHKLYGPTGIGALWARRELLDAMPPFIGGGTMISKVTKEEIGWAPAPARFEAGTPPIGEAIGLAAAIEWLRGVGVEAAHARDRELAAYALERLAEVPGIELYGPPAGDDRAGIISFTIEGAHAHDVAEILNRHAIAVRAGHHCAQVLMDRLGVAATTRASFAVHTTEAEIDRLAEALLDVRSVLAL